MIFPYNSCVVADSLPPSSLECSNPPGLIMAMTPEQLRDLIRDLRPGPTRKVESYSSGDADEWKTWRRHFEVVAGINGWNAQRARREAFAALQGKAAEYVADIPLADNAAAAPVGGLLDAYEARFLPQAAGDLARANLRHAMQREEETMLQWHARVRSHFTLAYPNLAVAELNANRDLIEKFVLGINHPTVRNEVFKARPVDYARALEIASNHAAAEDILSKTTFGSVKEEKDANGGVNAIDRRNPSYGPLTGCFNCGGGHYVRDCPAKRDFQGHQRRGRRGAPRGSFQPRPRGGWGGSWNGTGRGWHGSGRGRGRGKASAPPRGRQMRQVHFMGSQEAEGDYKGSHDPVQPQGEDRTGAENC